MLINTENACIDRLIIHRVGNRMLEDTISITKMEVAADDFAMTTIWDLFSSHLKDQVMYHFFHETDPSLNEIHTRTERTMALEENFIPETSKIAQYYYDLVNNAKIKGGELWFALVSGIMIEEEEVKALAIIKTEDRQKIIKLMRNEDSYGIITDSGYSDTGFVHGALIMNYEKEKGYLIALSENGKGPGFRFFTDGFLMLRMREDEYFFTQSAMQMCRDFITKKLPEDFTVERADQVDLLNKSLEYFKGSESFNQQDFAHDVFQDDTLVDSFMNFSKQYAGDQEFQFPEEFAVSEDAVKKQSKILKSIIKLDKNFHIYIHGNRSLIKRAYDEEQNMNYYQLYYKEEN